MNAVIQCLCGAVIIYQTEMHKVTCKCGRVFSYWPTLYSGFIAAKKLTLLETTPIDDVMLGAIASELREKVPDLPNEFYFAYENGLSGAIPSSIKDIKEMTSYRMPWPPTEIPEQRPAGMGEDAH